MNIYKLKYTTEAAAKKDLEAKGITVTTDKGTTYGEGVQAIVYIGKIVDKPATIVDGKVTVEATYLSGYHVDVMSEKSYKFGTGIEQVVNNPRHIFAGN